MCIIRKNKKKPKNKLKVKHLNFIKNNLLVLHLFVFIIVFPLIIALIYLIPCKQILPVDIGELLSFYGATLGLVGAAFTYVENKAKHENEMFSIYKPKFIIRENIDSDDTLSYTVKNVSANAYKDVFIYNTFVDTVLLDDFNLVLCKNDMRYNYKVKVNYEKDVAFDENDEHPSYIQICCTDLTGKDWNCVYKRINIDGHYWYVEDFVIPN